MMCKSEFDVAVTPPILYICSGGIWYHWDQNMSSPVVNEGLQWPDCSGEIISNNNNK